MPVHTRLLVTAFLFGAGCANPSDPAGPDDPAGSGLFAAGCPDGQSLARVIATDDRLPGAVAVGSRGDVLLANDHAAFVITAAGPASPDTSDVTYWHYGGAVADAAPMVAPCTPGEDKLDEIGLLIGTLRFDDVAQSVLRGFRADTVEVVADGSNGEAAVVQATGVDDVHWLLEYELIKRGVGGDGRVFSEPLQIQWTVDYRLAPDTGVLSIEHSLENLSDEALQLVLPALLSFAPGLEPHRFSDALLDVGPLTLRTGIPFLSATDGDVGYAWSPRAGNLAYVGISGIDVAIDLEHATTDPVVVPPGQGASRSMLFSVSEGDGARATEALARQDPELIPGRFAEVGPFSGRVLDADGLPLPDCPVIIEADSGSGFDALDQAHTDAEGRFTAWLPVFEEPWSFRVQAQPAHRDPSDPIEVVAGDEVQLEVGDPSTLELEVTSGGAPSPAKLVLRRSDGAERTVYTDGSSIHPLPAGDWTWTLTRGWEHQPATGSVTLPASGTGEISAELPRVVDTSGWITVDTHTHSSQSPDSDLPPEEQLLQAAAHGLEVVVHSEHENVPDLWGLSEQLGLGAEVVGIVGQEVTAPIPEHMTAFPIEPDGTLRGGPIPWYGQDVAEMYASIDTGTGGGIRILNHPGYMDLIGWDYLDLQPTLDEAWQLGLGDDPELWSWDFEGIEVMNGTGSPFSRGRFDKWMSLANAGHPKAGVGCSDDHGRQKIGWSRTYARVPDDAPDAVTVDDVVSAFQAGTTSIGAGAFVTASVGDAGPGELVSASGTVDLAIYVASVPEIDISHVVVFANCDQVASLPADDPDAVVKLDTLLPVDIDQDTHLVVAAFGAEPLPDGLPSIGPTTPRGMTGTILVDADDNGVFDAPGGRVCSYDLAAP